jgi:DNA-binding GntR family transcriptional regulator
MSAEEIAKIIKQTAEITAHQTVVNLLKKGMLKSDQDLTLHQVRERFDISSTTVRRWVAEGALKMVVRGNKKFYQISHEKNI